MTELRKVVIAKAMGAKINPSGDISDVEKKTKDMTIIDQAMETARKLAGTDVLTEEMKRKEDKLEEERKAKEKAEKDLAKKETELVEERLGSKIDKLTESISRGASPQSIAEQIGDIKKAAGELGLGGSKVSEFKEMATLIQSLNPQKDLAAQVKDARDLLTALQPERGKESLVEGVPAAVAIELKKMDSDFKIRLEQMADARQERDQNFQITLKKWEEDREIRRQEVDGKILVERERNQMIAGGLEIIGKAAGKAYAESGGGLAASLGSVSQRQSGAAKTGHIEIDQGQSGTFECPNCHSPIGVGPTSVTAQCVKCSSRFPIARIPSSVQGGVPSEQVSTESISISENHEEE
jgi:hypothetical protein